MMSIYLYMATFLRTMKDDVRLTHSIEEMETIYTERGPSTRRLSEQIDKKTVKKGK